ncbi:serine/threonine protein kinase [Sulfuricurvum kujiense DSM 16994]|uniref:Serine/threonine protein kinase n=1 Tax=Sulfuricurvum kujiense (strain ATCC BAA-921 / DSM 16994 / JCM 11577 / YK-1) TaxID=709032 RepID=E4TZD4_SULKY|nr:leucine-rich repeat-containing protein kinase family protein [Sulfuricurvum kujiense]ADR35161.1 serine/threonine protein kinase [Sulfuricurvum kujiense DSM 16994]
MHTLAQLRSGELKGATRLTLRENLTSFPEEIFDLADTLEILDLSNNRLSSLPNDINRLKKLKIAFFSNNRFTSLPSFKGCEHLYMVGFKSNQIETFDEEVLPESISWLILTDNRLVNLPRSIGNLCKLQKCALAGNQLESLPDEMASCRNLELLRLSANNLHEIPSWLWNLPKLSWLAFSGNPCSPKAQFELQEIAYESLEVKEKLGSGASGDIYKAYSNADEQSVALKLFKGAITSDGYAHDEMNATMSTGEHPNLIKVLSKVAGDERLGLVLEYIPDVYRNLGLPPDFETCTRDTFTEETSFSIETVYAVAKAIASAAAHLHARGLMHGDLYAHNILINDDDHCYLGDFGAASFYEPCEKAFEKIEVRAFGCLIEDMLSLCPAKEGAIYTMLEELREKCMNEAVEERPLFSEMGL